MRGYYNETSPEEGLNVDQSLANISAAELTRWLCNGLSSKTGLVADSAGAPYIISKMNRAQAKPTINRIDCLILLEG